MRRQLGTSVLAPSWRRLKVICPQCSLRGSDFGLAGDDQLDARTYRHLDVTRNLVKVAVDHIPDHAVGASDDCSAGDVFERLPGPHGFGAVDAWQFANERQGRRVDSEHVEPSGPLGIAMERLEIEANVRNGASGHGEKL